MQRGVKGSEVERGEFAVERLHEGRIAIAPALGTLHDRARHLQVEPIEPVQRVLRREERPHGLEPARDLGVGVQRRHGDDVRKSRTTHAVFPLCGRGRAAAATIPLLLRDATTKPSRNGRVTRSRHASTAMARERPRRAPVPELWGEGAV